MRNFRKEKMKNSKFYFFSLFVYFINSAIAGDGFYSARSEIFENPFFAIGVNNSNSITGYVSALRTSPGNTDECKFMFKGKMSGGGAAVVDIVDASSQRGISKKATARISSVQNGYAFNVKKERLPPDCDWILSFIGEPVVVEKDGEFDIKFEIAGRGDWISIAIVSGKKTFFYSSPDDKSKLKSYLVPGDVVYVNEETSGWLFVKYQRGKKITSGWIRQEDTQKF